MKVTVKHKTITHSLITHVFPEEGEHRFRTKREAKKFVSEMKARCSHYGFTFNYDIVKGW